MKDNHYEHWVSTFVILVGTCFVAYFIGNITSLVTEGDRIKAVKVQKMEEAQAFCDHKKLPRELARAILSHIRYHCGYNYVFDEADLIETLPPYLQNDIHSYLGQFVLWQLDFLKSLRRSSSQILGQIALKMQSVSCNEGYCLFSRGNRAKEFYIQRTGDATVYFDDGTTRRISRGDVVGQQSIYSPKRKYTVRCNTFSEFYILSVQEVIALMQSEYPSSWDRRYVGMI